MAKEWTAQEIRRFLIDENNIENCTECPYNEGCDDYQHRKPCGQWNCWVAAHCEEQQPIY